MVKRKSKYTEMKEEGKKYRMDGGQKGRKEEWMLFGWTNIKDGQKKGARWKSRMEE